MKHWTCAGFAAALLVLPGCCLKIINEDPFNDPVVVQFVPPPLNAPPVIQVPADAETPPICIPATLVDVVGFNPFFPFSRFDEVLVELDPDEIVCLVWNGDEWSVRREASPLSDFDAFAQLVFNR